MNRTKLITAAFVLTILLLLSLGPSTARELRPQREAQAAAPAGAQAALGFAFTYQGCLLDNETPVDNVCDFQFALWDDPDAGTQVAGPQEVTGVPVSDGRFTVQLDFGNIFDGTAYWLEVEVQCSGDAGYTTLSPRQALTPAPYAMALPGLWTQLNITSTNLIGGYNGNSVADGVVGATIGGGGNSSNPHRVTDDYGTVGGGLNNQAGDGTGTATDMPFATVSGGLNNVASGNLSTAGGGRDNVASGIASIVGGGSDNEASNYYATIGGGSDNVASGTYATVGGGEENLVTATHGTIGGGAGGMVTGDYAIVGGGWGNNAANQYATVAGGEYNAASGYLSTIGGGDSNEANGTGAFVGGGSVNIAQGMRASIAGGFWNEAQGDNSAIGGGEHNTASGDYATISGGYSNTAAYSATVGGGVFNTASSACSTIGGGMDNTANEACSTIGGGGGNTASGYVSTIGGGIANTASGFYAAVGGGGFNAASGKSATIGGGWDNEASSDYATIAGGYNITVTGAYASAGGGLDNLANTNYATIGGGHGNVSANWATTIGGGENNQANGAYATVPGGRDNVADDPYSFAAGRRAKAYANGCFVWGDSFDDDVECINNNRWIARSSGGVWFYTSGDLSSGVYILAGGNSWIGFSDRALKENLAPANGQAILKQLAALPIYDYNLKSQDPSIRHVGPVAQDFATLGYGESDTGINMQDADGIALAAIQGLYDLVQEKDAHLSALQAETAAQQQQINDLEARLAALETRADDSGPSNPWASNLLSGTGIFLAMLSVVWVTRRRGGGR